MICVFVKRFCKSFYRQNDLQSRFTENRKAQNDLRFCKMILQIVLSAERLAKSFYRKSESADYDRGKNKQIKASGEDDSRV